MGVCVCVHTVCVSKRLSFEVSFHIFWLHHLFWSPHSQRKCGLAPPEILCLPTMPGPTHLFVQAALLVQQGTFLAEAPGLGTLGKQRCCCWESRHGLTLRRCHCMGSRGVDVRKGWIVLACIAARWIPCILMCSIH